MHTVFVIAIGVAVAALIGGVTNYLAIRMLFRPRRPWHIGPWRVPFTPGLIPKRREEIALSLGRVVAGYLVTSDALSRLLESRAFQDRITGEWAERLRDWLAGEPAEWTLRVWAERWLPVRLDEDWLAGMAGRLDEGFREGFVRFWQTSGAADKPLAELLPDWTAEKRGAWAAKLARYAAEALGKELASPDGERLIVDLTKQFVDQAGGFFGAMAALFMDEYKVAAKVRLALLEALAGETAARVFVRFFDEQLAKAETKTPRELLLLAGLPADDAAGLAAVAGGLLRWEAWLSRALEWQPGPWLARQSDRIAGALPDIVSFVLQLASRHADRLVKAIRLEEIVERQVRDFPIERLEEIIVNISGREFRAITWLGALLGGIIGLVQGILLQLLS